MPPTTHTPAPPPQEHDGPSELDVTGPIDFQRLGLDSLPFDPNAQAPLMAPLVEEAHPEAGGTAFVDAGALGLEGGFINRTHQADQSVDETGFLDSASLGDLGDALPFEEGAPVRLTPVAEDAYPEAGAMAFVDVASLGIPNQPQPAPATQSVDGTGFLDPSTLGDLDEPLPFDEDAPVSAPEKVGLLPHRARGGTKLLAPGAVVPPSTPFPATENQPAPSELLSDVRRYASYRVDLLRAPHEIATTRARYGIANDQVHADLVAAFDARFADDPNLAAEYQEAVQTYSAWLNNSGGSHA